MQKILSLGMFDLRTELYQESVERLPAKGQQIIGYHDETSIVVYQAFKKALRNLQYLIKHLEGRTSVTIACLGLNLTSYG